MSNTTSNTNTVGMFSTIGDHEENPVAYIPFFEEGSDTVDWNCRTITYEYNNVFNDRNEFTLITVSLPRGCAYSEVISAHRKALFAA